jgi:CubicO group peptidase (beta-lactamase class C family)
MKYAPLAAAVALVALSVAPANAQALPTEGMRERLDAVVDRSIREHRIVGTVILVSVDGKVVYRRAAGYADREANRPMHETDLFRLASMTKTIVSTAALALVDQGKLRLDDPVHRWIPEFRPRLADGRTPEITVRHLLTHTAGLTYGFLEPADGPYHRAGISDGLDEAPISLPENIRRIASVPLSYAPGTSWGYSVAIDVLGEVVARASGQSLPDAVSHLVTEPLSMRDTAFVARDPKRLTAAYFDGTPEPKRMADPQVVPFGGASGPRFSPGRALDPKAFPSGGAGMVGTADDYLRFLEELRTRRQGLLRYPTWVAMRKVQTGALPVNGEGSGLGFGYGFAVLADPAAAKSPQSAGTFQWGGAYGHSWFVDPTRRVTVVALTNTAFEGMSGKFTLEVRDAVYGVAGR